MYPKCSRSDAQCCLLAKIKTKGAIKSIEIQIELQFDWWQVFFICFVRDLHSVCQIKNVNFICFCNHIRPQQRRFIDRQLNFGFYSQIQSRFVRRYKKNVTMQNVTTCRCTKIFHPGNIIKLCYSELM